MGIRIHRRCSRTREWKDRVGKVLFGVAQRQRRFIGIPSRNDFRWNDSFQPAMYNASRASRPIRALNGDFSFNARVLTNRSGEQRSPAASICRRGRPIRFERNGRVCWWLLLPDELVRSFSSVLGEAQNARQHANVYVRVGCIHIHTLFLRPLPDPSMRVCTACAYRLSSRRGNYIELDSGSENWEELDGVVQSFALVERLYSNTKEDTREII